MAAAPPAFPDEFFEEILLRLPPDDPACLLRASLVCKTWSGIVSHPAFRRRLHEIHRAPPVLGFFHDWVGKHIPDFVSTTASSPPLAAAYRRFWRALDCRHGRALFLSQDLDTQVLLLWEPITGAHQPVPVPASFESDWSTAAVFCTADGCDHHDCFGGPFCVVFVFAVEVDPEKLGLVDYVTSAWVYSSETGAWGELNSMHDHFSTEFTCYSSVLVGRSLLYFMSDSGLILEYDLARQGRTLILPPGYDYESGSCDTDSFNLMLAGGGGLGLNQAMDPHLKLWWEACDGTDAKWVLSRVIYLENLLPNGALVDAARSVHASGYAEGANVIFMTTVAGLFMIELQPERVKKVCDDIGFCNLIPVVSFYTPVHKDPSSKPGEDAGGEEGGEEEKIVDQAQELFDNGSSVTKEGGFVHTIQNRVPPYGEVAPGSTSTVYGHGCGMLYEAQEVTDPLGHVPKSVRNEESVKSSGTSSKDDAGNSKDIFRYKQQR